MEEDPEGDRRIRRVVLKTAVPNPIGPYSHVVLAGGFAFVSGQGPKDPATGKYVEGGIKEQTKQVVRNIEAVLKSVDLELRDVVKANVYLRDIRDFGAFNEAYGEFFGKEPPARTTVQASLPAQEMQVEIEVLAKTRD